MTLDRNPPRRLRTESGGILWSGVGERTAGNSDVGAEEESADSSIGAIDGYRERSAHIEHAVIAQRAEPLDQHGD